MEAGSISDSPTPESSADGMGGVVNIPGKGIHCSKRSRGEGEGKSRGHKTAPSVEFFSTPQFSLKLAEFKNP